MAARDEIVRFCDTTLDAAGYPDALPVGLQVPGAADVAKVASGVSASLELLRRATASGAQMLFVHHGLFWKNEPRRIDARLKARLQTIFDGDLSLLAYHLCLDAHPGIGNNALLCQALELTALEPFAEHHGRTIGFVGTASPALTVDELAARVSARIAPEPLVFPHGPAAIERIAVVSGAAVGDLDAAADAGADAFVTGEPAEPAMYRAAEAGVHFVAAGHHATEVFGVRALGNLVAETFGVEHEFIDVPNPV
jgi:dinuclear metal center YbgI/SA1388 family protein